MPKNGSDAQMMMMVEMFLFVFGVVVFSSLINCLFNVVYCCFWKCNFPMNPHMCPRLVSWLVGSLLVGWLVSHNFQKRRQGSYALILLPEHMS